MPTEIGNEDLTSEKNQGSFIPEEEEESQGDEELEGNEEGDENQQVERLSKRLKTMDRKYGKAVKDLEKFREKEAKRQSEGKELSEEEKKEKQAAEYLEKKTREILEKIEKQKTEKEAKEIEELSEEMDEVLEENEDLKESQILKLIETFAEKKITLRPRQAATILKEDLLKIPTETKKPKMPSASRGSGEIKPTKEEEEKLSSLSFDEKIEHAKRSAANALKKIIK